MKTKEAPEKLYITYKGYGVFDEDSTVERTKDSQTEYTRTDAFIEKATWWLSKHFYDEEYQSIDNEGTWIDADELIEDLKKYMED
jgi:hypothetical protein